MSRLTSLLFRPELILATSHCYTSYTTGYYQNTGETGYDTREIEPLYQKQMFVSKKEITFTCTR